MKTFARMRVVAAASVKKVAKVVVEVIDVEPVGVPVFDEMDLNELREMAKEEGITRAGKDEFDLRDGLEKEYELYPSDV